MTILESNKLIAEFMGYMYIPKSISNTEGGWYKEKPEELLNFIPKSKRSPFKLCRHHHQLRYHSSWDWLMPVVIKMVSGSYYLQKFRVDYTLPYIEGNPLAVFSTTKKYDCNLTLKTLYKEVIEFIQWYNKNTNNGKI